MSLLSPPVLLLALLLPTAPPRPEAPAAPQTEAAREPAVEDLLERGRALLDQGRADEALPLLEAADARAQGAPEVRVWLIRCWIARGFVNDALDAADDLSAAGVTGPALDYLYGLAFHARAKEHIRLQTGGGLIEMNLGDAARLLAAATEADPERYGDAFLPLAESAWHAQDLPAARAAAERALARRPEGVAEAYMLGRVAFSQYVAASGDGGGEGPADALWLAAHDAFARGIESAGEPEDPTARRELADCYVQLAYTHAWRKETEALSEALSAAMGWDPAAVDYRSLWSYLEPLGVLRCLERGELAFVKRHGPAAVEDATLLWWLGWANFSQQFHPEAEKAYARALKKEPTWADCSFYVGLSRYHQKDYDGAIEALTAGCLSNVERVLGAAKPAADTYAPVLAWLVDRCAKATPTRNLEAGVLSELRARMAETDPLPWSYAGLFYRDAGDALRRGGGEDAKERRAVLYEKALACYERALALEPEHPNYLNDTAVVLHYCLNRDLDRARALYRRAQERAEAELRRDDLPRDLRDLYSIALRDSRDNLARLGEGR